MSNFNKGDIIILNDYKLFRFVRDDTQKLQHGNMDVLYVFGPMINSQSNQYGFIPFTANVELYQGCTSVPRELGLIGDV